MSLINPALLYGLGLAVIPVVLHLMLRAKPKRLPFPALRLIQARRTPTVRRLRLRHLWLLLLRILVIALLVLAIARPSLPAADYSPSGREILTTFVLAAMLLAAYFGLVRFWQSRRLPNHLLAYRRSVLRGSLGVAALMLLLLLVAWPYQRRIAAELTAPPKPVARDIPAAAVFLFDTSPSMQYRHQGDTRLEAVKRLAQEHLSHLPAGSKVAVADLASTDPLVFLGDLTGAQGRIDAVEPQAVSRPLEDRLRRALELQEEDRRRVLAEMGAVPEEKQHDRFVREVYLFTDMTRGAWGRTASSVLREELQRLGWLGMYLIDVGVEQPINVGITNVRLPRQTITQGGPLIVEATVTATGGSTAKQTLELYLRGDDGALVKQGQTQVEADPTTAAEARFAVEGVGGHFRQGEIRLSGSDPLPVDDVGYFTVEVQPSPEILVVAEDRAEAYTWMQRLAPSELVKAGRALYRPTFLPTAKLSGTELSRYDVVCLINATAPTPEMWQQLSDYVGAGGGLAVFLGAPSSVAADGSARRSGINPVAYNSDAAQKLLPAKLLASLRFSPAQKLDLKNLAHPLLQRFGELPGAVAQFSSFDIRRYWKVEPRGDGTVIAGFTDANHTPALLERPLGRGRVLVFATSVDSVEWNDLMIDWTFLAFADQMMQYLSQRAAATFNYAAGDTVFLPIPPDRRVRHYLLRKPEFQQLRGEIPADTNLLMISQADQVGHYAVVPAENEAKFDLAFSVNPPSGESDFTRITEAELDERLGKDRYGIARDMDALESKVLAGRIGQEVFPWLVLFLIAVFCTEHLVANWFYGDTGSENWEKITRTEPT